MGKKMTVTGKLIVRSLRQNRGRTLAAFAGVAFSVCVFVLISCGALWYYSYMRSIEISTNGWWQIRLNGLSGEQAGRLRDEAGPDGAGGVEGVKRIEVREAGDGSFYADLEMERVDEDIFDEGQKIGEMIGMDRQDTVGEAVQMPSGEPGAYDVSYHMELLDFYGIAYQNGDTSVRTYLVGILVLLVGIFSVFLYDIFAVSYMDKRRYIGLLACAGASVRQRRLLVMGEGLVIGVAAIPLGLILGGAAACFGASGVRRFFEEAAGVHAESGPVLDVRALAAAVLLGLLVILFAAFLPTAGAGRVSPLDCLSGFRGQSGAGTQRYAFRCSVGAERNLGRKNLLCYRGRSLTMIGLLAFLLAAAPCGLVYVRMMKGEYLLRDRREYGSLDSWLSVSSGDLSAEETLYRELSGWKELSGLSCVSELDMGEMLFPAACMDEDLDRFVRFGNLGRNPVRRINEQDVGEEKYAFWTEVTGMDETSFERYAKEQGISLDGMESMEYPVIIDDYMLIQTEDGTEPSYRGVLDIAPGQRITVEYDTYGRPMLLGSDLYVSGCTSIELDVLGVTEEPPPIPQSPDDYRAELENLSQLKWVCFHVYMPYERFRSFLEDERVKKVYGKMPQGANPWAWSEDNPIDSRLYFDVPAGTDEKKLRERIAAVAAQAGLREYDGVLDRGGGEQEDCWEYGSTDIIKKERYRNPGKLMREWFAAGTVVFVVCFALSAWANSMLMSMRQRRREFIVLRSVGMSMSGLGRMLAFETAVLTAAAGVIGTLAGCAGVAEQFREAGKYVALEAEMPVGFILAENAACILFAGVILMISVKSVKELNILEVLRNENT